MKKGFPLLTTTAYFPPAHWLRAAANSKVWRIEQYENYQKGGFRNRCRIIGPNGKQTLTVPLAKGKNQRQPITEVRISYDNDWWRSHEQAIRTAYGRAPYFEFYAEEVFTTASHPYEFLWQLNAAVLGTVLRLLQSPVMPEPTDDFVLPKTTGYLRPADLDGSLPEYQQVFTDRHGFTPGLSVLDALFCLGPGMLV